MVSLTIDGNALRVPKGTRVIVAAEQAGIYIPRFCYHPALEVLGACRVCLVRVELPATNRATGQPELDEAGEPVYRPMPTLQTSCTLEVAEGMRVITDSDDVRDGRERIIEFLLANHPLDCPICDKGGECLLQEMTMLCGPGRQLCVEPRVTRDKARPIGGGIVLDQERCIVCFRCTRFLSEWADEMAFDFTDRGNGNEIETPFRRPVEHARFLGNTIDLCPVGALTSETFRFSARPWELADTPGVCPVCPVGCNLTLGGRLGTLCRVQPRQNYQVNDQWICDRSRFGLQWVNEGRLTEPLVRPGLQLRPESWAAALDAAVFQMRRAESTAVVIDPSVSCEAGWAVERICRLAFPGARVRVEDDFHAAGPFHGSLMQLAYAEVVLTVGADILEEQPILWLRLNRRARQGRQRLVTLAAPGRADDQKRLSWKAANLRPGRESALLNGLRLALRDPSRAGAVAGETGLEPGWVGEVLAAITSARSVGLVLGPVAPDDYAMVSEALAALADELKQAKGRAVPHGFVLGGANSRGLRLVGCGTEPHAFDWRKALRSRTLDGVLFVGGDPLAGADDELRDAAMKLGACVTIATNHNATTDLSSVVLPAASFAEAAHSLVSFEGRLQHSEPTNSPIRDTLPDYEILTQLGLRLGLPAVEPTAAAIRREIAGTAENLRAFAEPIPPEGVLLGE